MANGVTTRLQGLQKEVQQNQLDIDKLQEDVQRLDAKIDLHGGKFDSLQADVKKILEVLLPKEGAIASTGGDTGVLPNPISTDRGKQPEGSAPYDHIPPALSPSPNPSQYNSDAGILGSHPLTRALYSGPVKLWKAECPKFSGDDFKGWLLKLEQYFEAEKVADPLKV